MPHMGSRPNSHDYCDLSIPRDVRQLPAPRRRCDACRSNMRRLSSRTLVCRHTPFRGLVMVNELEMPSEDVAIALGHQDGGNLVRRLYGHRDTHRALGGSGETSSETSHGSGLAAVGWVAS